MNYSHNSTQQSSGSRFSMNNSNYYHKPKQQTSAYLPLNLDKQIKCSICKAKILKDLIFTNPSCSHNYCLYCIQEILEAQINLSECYSEYCSCRLNQRALDAFVEKAGEQEDRNSSKYKGSRNPFEANSRSHHSFSSHSVRHTDHKQRPKQRQRQQSQVVDEFSNSNCAICLDSLSSHMALHLLNCRDVFHIECLENYLVDQIDQRRFPIRCPNTDCKREIDPNDINDSLQTRLIYQQKYEDYSFKYCLDSHPDQYVNCLTPNCQMTFIRDYGVKRLNCPSCRKSYCLQCETEYHEGMSCSQFAESKNNQTDEYFYDFAAQQNYKRCPQCRMFVEKSEGCMHMQCTRCQTEFCYRCGQRRNGNCVCE